MKQKPLSITVRWFAQAVDSYAKMVDSIIRRDRLRAHEASRRLELRSRAACGEDHK